MIQFLRAACTLAAVFFCAGPAGASTLYQFFEGGPGGTLEVQFSTPEPLTQAYFDANKVFLPTGGPPALGVNTPSGGFQEYLLVFDNATRGQSYFPTTGFYFILASGTLGEVGTHDLVPGTLTPDFPGNFFAHGSFYQIGSPGGSVPPQFVHLLDTVVITDTSMPEPASVVLFGIGIASIAGYWLTKSRWARRCYHSE